MKKRFWALLLAVMMVVSVLPTTAFAATDTYRDGWSFIFTRTQKDAEYVQAAVKSETSYVLSEGVKSTLNASAYTFYLGNL